MKVSLNTIKSYTGVDLSVDELVARINSQLGGVEEIIDLGAKYAGARIAKVVQCEKHPNADKLNVCLIDDGGVEKDVERNADKLIQVVCGAPNVRAGLMVVWLPPGSTVPASFGDAEPFVLGSRELRGVMSCGMLASPKELALGDNHEGILEIDPDEWKPSGVKVVPGASFAAAYGLDDTTIVIENKMFTHRPDCFGQLGVAREIAGIQHNVFVSPDWYRTLPTFKSGDGLELTVQNEAIDKVPRFMAVALSGVTVKPSPIWLQAELVRLGSKPINNIVDVTNYVMLLTGQPLHAYDYDKLHGKKLGARFATKDEQVTLLNGKRYTLTPDDVVIVDGDGPVGLGGVMGGGESEVSGQTKNIVLECATFDMYAIRKTSMRHGLFTDAVTRFNKGQSPLQNEYILSLAVHSLFDVAGGELATQIFDLHGSKPIQEPRPVSVSPRFINQRLGLSLTAKDIAKLLTNVEFIVTETMQSKETTLKITAPFWRTDIELPEDIVEEIGRLYGFDKLPRELPRRTMVPAAVNERLRLKQTIRESLAKSGGNEVLTYSFVHERLLKNASQSSADAFRLSNALSPDLQYYRLSLLPSLLDKVHGNIKTGHDEFALFELGKGHHKQNINADGLPNETDMVEMVYAAKRSSNGSAYYTAHRLVDQLCHDLGLRVTYEKIETDKAQAGMAPYDTARSAYVRTSTGAVIGIVGELKRSVRKGFKLPEHVAAASLDIHSIEKESAKVARVYRPLSRFPSVSQDLSLRVEGSVSYGSMMASVENSLASLVDEELHVTAQPLSIYQANSETAHKTITLRFIVSSYKATLTDKAVGKLLDSIAENALRELKAVRI